MRWVTFAPFQVGQTLPDGLDKFLCCLGRLLERALCVRSRWCLQRAGVWLDWDEGKVWVSLKSDDRQACGAAT